jgi:pyruvate ferredoxin oxidoreductase beta subunit
MKVQNGWGVIWVIKMNEEELLYKGHTACAGCNPMIAIRHVLKAAGPNTIVSNATSCSEIVSSKFPTTSWKIPYIHVAFECSAAVASGIEAACKKLGRDVNVIVIAGDGGTYDIGLQSLSGMVDRGHNVLYVCYDNECYANTGIQRSSATPYGAWTTTSPPGSISMGNKTFKKPIAEMMAAQGAVYVATSSVAYPKDIQRKVKKALSIKGPKFLLIHSPCTIAWKFQPEKGIEIAKLAVETGLWVLYELENGKMAITMKPKERKKVEEYLKTQKRFSHLKEKEIHEIQEKVDKDWEEIEKKNAYL